MAAPRHNLPFPITSFVGRQSELAALSELMQRPGVRLITLTGPAGVGKTRLALELTTSALNLIPEGAWLVDLATLTETSLVAQAVASLLCVTEQPGRPLLETLSDACRTKALLLVLDTCEHLIGPCAELAGRLLSACPRLRILTTSRIPLGIAGETVWEIPPLRLPEPSAKRSVSDLYEFEAIRLFIDRASGVLPGFRLTEHNAPTIAHICNRLDGIPLAIELASVWVRTLMVEQIAVRIDNRFHLLTGGSRTAPPRQQTLRAAIAWSCDLLLPAERTLFARCSVFAGACTLEAIEAVCEGDGIERQDILSLLSSLVGASLVATEERGGQKRYRLLETLRAYGRELSVISGEVEATNLRHALHYLTLAESAEPALWGSDMALWLERLESEHDDLRAALRWSVGRGEAELALRLGAALSRFWRIRGHLSEGQRWLEGGLAWTTGITPTTRARALDAAGHLARDRGDYEGAALFYDQALTLRRELGDQRGIALSLNAIGVVAQFRGSHADVISLHEESLHIFRVMGDKQGIGVTLLTLGVMAHLRQDFAQATAWLEEALRQFRQLDDKHGIAATLTNLGNLASACGDQTAAEVYYTESLDRFRGLGEPREVASCLRNLAEVARDCGKPAQSKVFCDQSLTLSAELGDTWGVAASLLLRAHIAAEEGNSEEAISLFGTATTAGDLAAGWPPITGHRKTEEILRTLKGVVGPHRFATSWALGRSMTPIEAITSVISPHRPVETRSTLSRREQDVASLIQRGLTNRQIAETLFVAERTVDKHVEHILAKLSLRSRAQVASWATERNLSPPSRTEYPIDK